MGCAKSNEGLCFEVRYTDNLVMEGCDIKRINQSVSPGRKVLGDFNYLGRCEDGGSPVSPTANLKLLTKVASKFEKKGTTAASIRKEDIPKKKELQLYYTQHQPDENFKSRKDKSLGSLCSKFLQLFPPNLSPGEHMVFSLDQAVSDLGTERRRIYDIINILESLQMATKVAKNHYMWYGNQYLHITLASLKGLAVHLRLPDQDLTEMGESSQSAATSFLDKSTEHSLGVMCQKFLMIFLISSKSDFVTLDLAASVLLSVNMVEKIAGEEDDVQPCRHKFSHDRESESSVTRLKTTVRRLYDIANVLTSLGLIHKVQNTEGSGRKPTFKYTGPSVEAAPFTDEDIRLLQGTRHSLLGSTPDLGLRKSAQSCDLSSARHEIKQHDAGNCETCSHTKSENWSGSSKRKAPYFAEESSPLSDILRVAEMELKRLEYQEMTSCHKSARKKLFPRHHSETCVVPVTHQVATVSGVSDKDLCSGVKEECLDSHTSRVFTGVKNENVSAGVKALERPLKVQKIGTLHKSSSFNSLVSGKEVKVIRKLVKFQPLLPKKENHIASPMREMNFSVIENNSRDSNIFSQFQSPLIAKQINVTNLSGTTTRTLPCLKTSRHPVQSSHVKETDSLTPASSADVGSSVPKVLCLGKGVTITRSKFPAPTQLCTLSSSNSMASGHGNNVLVPSQPVIPKQVCSPSGYVYQIGTGNIASALVPGGNIYQAVPVGSVLQLVPLCNNSMSLTK